MEGHYIPTAFFACRSDLYKSELRDNLARVVVNRLHITDKFATTPWKISLYHIEEFEIHPPDEMQKHLQRLKAIYNRDKKPTEMTCLSSGNMGFSRYSAHMLLNEPDAARVVDRAREKRLNYIIHGIYDNSESLTPVIYNDDSKAFYTLQNIVSDLINIKSRYQTIDLNNSFYAYRKNETLRFIQ